MHTANDLAARGEVCADRGVGTSGAPKKGVNTVGLILLVLLIALLLGGLGFAVHFLWIVAVIVFLFWLIGFGFARGETAGGRRWYRW